MATRSLDVPTSAVPSLTAGLPAIPQLEPGDCLTRPEFERRYAAMPDLKKAELLEGVVYLPSPVSDRHGGPHSNLYLWTGNYALATPGVVGRIGPTIRLDLDNAPQPDICLRLERRLGGQSDIDVDHYIAGPPELLAEISSSTVSYDMHVKRNVYRRSGVQEYIVWRVLDQDLDWFVLEEGEYKSLAANGTGVLQSRVFPGLWLGKAALLQGDMPRVMEVLQQGLASPEHAAFVTRLSGSGGA